MQRPRVSFAEKNDRKALMAELGIWLKVQKRTQAWLGEQLGIYGGYVNKLLSGRQTASHDVVERARKLMSNGAQLAKKPSSSPAKKPAEKPKTAARVPTVPVKNRSTTTWANRISMTQKPCECGQLSAEAIETIASITVSYIMCFPEVSPEGVIGVIGGLKDGLTLRSCPRCQYSR